MSALAIAGTVFGGAKKAAGLLGGLNKGTCGQKCYGFGGALKRCRRRRKADCESVERQKEQQRAAAKREEQRILAQKNARYATAASVSNAPGMRITPGIGLAIGGGLLGVIFILFNFFMAR